jgi:hypothetical protein
MPNKPKRGRKPGSKVVFYTKAEDDFIKSVLLNGKTIKENSQSIGKKLKRPVASIAQRIIKFKKPYCPSSFHWYKNYALLHFINICDLLCYC